MIFLKKIEEHPVNISTVARFFGVKSKHLHHAYKHHLSDYQTDISSKVWCAKGVVTAIDEQTGEVLKEKPLYVCKLENMGESMCIDDKQIGQGSYTIMSNQETGKIALLIESVKFSELLEAMAHLGEMVKWVKSISCDMSPTYLKLCSKVFVNAEIVIDKFHVMQHVYDALQQVRLTTQKDLKEQLSEGKKRTEKDKIILADLELLKRTRHALNKSPVDWTPDQKQMMQDLFEKYTRLQEAYQFVQRFKQWYDVRNIKEISMQIEQRLDQWLEDVGICGIKAFQAVCKMINKHEKNILNYFSKAHTNAMAERINGKIKRFIANNYGIRDKDFALYRIAGYFS